MNIKSKNKSEISISHLSLAPLDHTDYSCKQCGYRRQNDDQTPEWACPSCGISYGLLDKSIDDTGQFFATRIKIKASVQSQAQNRFKAKKQKRKAHKLAKTKLLSLCLSVMLGLAASLLLVIPSESINKTEYTPQANQAKELHLITNKESLARN